LSDLDPCPSQNFIRRKLVVQQADMCEKASSKTSKYGFLAVLDDTTTPMYPDPLVSAVADPPPTLPKPGLAMPPPQPTAPLL
jgi:hypothetical protein